MVDAAIEAEGRTADGLIPKELDLLAGASDAVFLLDADLRIRWANPRAQTLTEAPLRTLLAQPIDALLETDALEASPLHPALAEGRGVHGVPARLLIGGGEGRSVRLTAIPVGDAGNGTRGLLILVQAALPRSATDEAPACRFHDLVGGGPQMQALYALIRQVAPTPASILVEGESGTGKELVARALHAESPRAAGPFVKVNCSALAESLLESELFGHVKGAFTGAIAQKVGRFEAADGGTIFLDEIGDLSHFIQLKLLRVIQEREFERVGSSRPIRTDVRLISATNKDLSRLVAAGRFREDLYYRLKVVPITLPPLRERREDIPLLVHTFLARFSQTLGKSVRGLTRRALDALRRHSWPGNVRELEHAIEHACIRCQGDLIGLADLPREFRGSAVHAEEAAGIDPERQVVLEQQLLERLLRQNGGNRSKTAQMLGIGRTTLWRRLKAPAAQPSPSRNVGADGGSS
ncbi:MAG: sigma 54-interacting transcriptional regulator [candidate division NC10 bacterium]|nr:sigma 54-interacting transcriptional regulator [candidate division NC10 bacterium]